MLLCLSDTIPMPFPPYRAVNEASVELKTGLFGYHLFLLWTTLFLCHVFVTFFFGCLLAYCLATVVSGIISAY